jgi:hypothetical protein
LCARARACVRASSCVRPCACVIWCVHAYVHVHVCAGCARVHVRLLRPLVLSLPLCLPTCASWFVLLCVIVRAARVRAEVGPCLADRETEDLHSHRHDRAPAAILLLLLLGEHVAYCRADDAHLRLCGVRSSGGGGGSAALVDQFRLHTRSFIGDLIFMVDIVMVLGKR